MRHGPGASHHRRHRAGRGAEPGARRHDAPVLHWPHARRPRVRADDGRHADRGIPEPSARRRADQLDRASVGVARGALVREAVFRAYVGVVRQQEPEHVHAHRHRCRRCVRVQRRRDDFPGRVSRRLPDARRTRGGRDLLRYHRRHHGPRASRTSAGAASAVSHGRSDSSAPRLGAEDGAGRSGWARRGRAARAGAGRRPPTRAPGREGSG